MVKLFGLAVMAVAITAVSSLDIKFMRYSKAGCHEDFDHIAADTHLEDPYCKSFDTDEPAFYSFKIETEDEAEDLQNKYCYAVVFDGEDCSGRAFTYGGMCAHESFLPSPIQDPPC